MFLLLSSCGTQCLSINIRGYLSALQADDVVVVDSEKIAGNQMSALFGVSVQGEIDIQRELIDFNYEIKNLLLLLLLLLLLMQMLIIVLISQFESSKRGICARQNLGVSDEFYLELEFRSKRKCKQYSLRGLTAKLEENSSKYSNI
ncbi:hypothetical protein GQX74_013406 [Glossina fuscipes]|nr:hypothetical protein GQX74_013406 [Glossina fuscipes]